MGLDYSLPDVDEPLPDDGRIQLVRVREEIVIEQEPLPFETNYEPLADLEIDHQRVIEPGTYGVVINRVRVRTEDGEETGRAVEGEFVAVEPQPRVIGYGTQIVIRTLFTDEGPVDYWRAVEMYATSYSPSRAGTSPDAPWYGLTASGQPLRKGLVAIDINYILFGTRMYVVGYGHAEAADIGGGVRGRWIDLGYEDHNFVNWHEYVTVYFLTPVPPASSIVWIFP
jgi:3D (Asp-Asp-Asp) domain-containing protein